MRQQRHPPLHFHEARLINVTWMLCCSRMKELWMNNGKWIKGFTFAVCLLKYVTSRFFFRQPTSRIWEVPNHSQLINFTIKLELVVKTLFIHLLNSKFTPGILPVTWLIFTTITQWAITGTTVNEINPRRETITKITSRYSPQHLASGGKKLGWAP
jgi:hypothetical protein